MKSSTSAVRADVWQVIIEVKFEVEPNNKSFDEPHVTQKGIQVLVFFFTFGILVFQRDGIFYNTTKLQGCFSDIYQSYHLILGLFVWGLSD